jgi:uncharacterized protein (TIGR00266 family)
MSQWYLSHDGRQTGPLTEEEAVRMARANPNGHAWRDGFATWQPIAQVAELAAGASAAAPPPAMPPPPAGRSRAHDIDYRIFGEEMQFVEIELDPGESAVAEAGAMMYKDASVRLETVFGDGSQQQTGSGFLGKLVGAGKRVLTGESLFMTVFTHGGLGKARVAFAAPYPGTIIPLDLAKMGGKLICQKDSFLAAARGVAIGLHFQKRILTGLFGGEGFIMQKLEGDGMAFVHAGGCVVERELAAGQTLHVDTGCIVALEPTVDFDIEQVGGIKSALFGGEGVFFARLGGPGKIWLQSLPVSRLAGRLHAAAPQAGGRRVGEGSVLGGLGDLLDGDRY